MRRILLLSLLATLACAAETHPTLAIGSPAPDFQLPGVDGKVHRLSDYASAKVLVVVFTCNHCPIAQLYEDRIKELVNDYRDKGVAVVAILGNDPNAIRVDELDSSDMSDTLDEMKIRAAYRHFNYPYLYDGATQSVTDAYGPKATPHVFIFDAQRKLRYEGRMDNSYRKELVKTKDARNAIDQLLVNEPVAVAHTGVFGCSTKWKEKQKSREEDDAKFDAEPVTLQMATPEVLKTLRANHTGKYLLVNFWATWCGPCVREFPELEKTYRMYRGRGDFDFVSVSTNMPDEKNSVLKMLQRNHAASRNLLFSTDDTTALQAAFDPQWQSSVPFAMVISPEGKIVSKKEGDIDFLALRRQLLANLPTDYPGFRQYWITP